jgi:hypothetical protein
MGLFRPVAGQLYFLSFSLRSCAGQKEDCCFLVLGFLRGVRGKFTDKVSETAVGPFFTGHEKECEFAVLLMTSEDGTHSGFRNLVGNFTMLTVQNPKNNNHFRVNV